jgi:CRISPR-associated protein Csx17
MILHRLDGCAPTPLAHYLKALGILRLVSEQLDPEARGWWEGERFLLASHKDEDELLEFFLERYSPTPLVSPWNKGSGFFYLNDPGLSPTERSTASRYGSLRQGIAAARAQLDAMSFADQCVREIKDEAKDKSLSKAQREALRKSEGYKKRLAEAERQFKQLKADLIPNLRLVWRGPHREWMDAAMALDEDGAASFPALLGTGGNDGRLDFTNNFFQRLNDLFDFADPTGRPRYACALWLREAMFGNPAQALASGLPVGQFAPGGAGGANASSGPEGNSRLNPADFVLALEGTLVFTAAASRRFNAQAPSRASAPFAVSGQSAGYASAADSDENARGEQWMPLWSAPTTLVELYRLLAEGRAQLGARSAQEPLDLARAVARLGTARGIHAFQRFGYIERNGQSNLAIPLGRFVVPDKASPKLNCLDDLEAWLPRLRRQARDRDAPNRLVQVERRLANALFAVIQHPEEASRWQAVLLCLADVEAVQVTGSGYKAGPIPRLRPEWITAADDGSTELRLALALALQARRFDRERGPQDGVRRHWLSLDGTRYATSGSGSQQRLQPGTDRVMRGRDGVDDAVVLVGRRLIEAGQRGERRLPLVAARSASAAPADLARLIAVEVDLNRTLAMARALMAIDAQDWARQPEPPQPAPADGWPDDAWLAVRLVLLPWPLPDGRRIGTDPAILRRLESGDAAGAVTLALRRLRAAGIGATVRIASVPAETARLWAAALAFPITPDTAARFVVRLDSNALKEINT